MKWKEKVNEEVEHCKKAILCVAPHTSNWDFFIGKLYYLAKRKKARFLMKKECFVFPLGFFLRKMGGIPVDRKTKVKLTDYLANLAHRETDFQLAITPEGTRSATKEWKKGFYFIAQKANIPILLYGIDYKKKLIACTKVLDPQQLTEEEVMQTIKAYFSNFTGKHPHKFVI